MKETLNAIHWDAAWLEATRAVCMALAHRAANAAVGSGLCDAEIKFLKEFFWESSHYLRN